MWTSTSCRRSLGKFTHKDQVWCTRCVNVSKQNPCHYTMFDIHQMHTYNSKRNYSSLSWWKWTRDGCHRNCRNYWRRTRDYAVQESSSQYTKTTSTAQVLYDLLSSWSQVSQKSRTEGSQCIRGNLPTISEVFSTNKKDTDRTNLITMDIDTGDSLLSAKKPYTVPLKHYDRVQQEIERLEWAGIITHSVSPWASPIVVVPKKSAPGEPQEGGCA